MRRLLLASFCVSFMGCPAPLFVGAAIIGGLSQRPHRPRPTPPDRDFYVSGRPVAQRELDCERVRPTRLQDTVWLAQGCQQQATYVLYEGAAGAKWVRAGEVGLVPPKPPRLASRVGRCDEAQVAELAGAGVPPSAIERACVDD